MVPKGAFGAVATFTGTVRDLNASLQSMTLEHYPAMTQKKIGDIANIAVVKFSPKALLVHHRYGHMTVGEPIVFVGVLSNHRKPAFQTCELVMDYLKNEAPFWKKETLKNGVSKWVEERAEDKIAQSRWKTR